MKLNGYQLVNELVRIIHYPSRESRDAMAKAIKTLRTPPSRNTYQALRKMSKVSK